MSKEFVSSLVSLKSFVFIAVVMMNGCASRGFKLSQQMPGMDNNLNPIFGEEDAVGAGYKIAADGSVEIRDQERATERGRQVASSKKRRRGEDPQRILTGLLYESAGAPIINSTLDPENGSLLLGKGK